MLVLMFLFIVKKQLFDLYQAEVSKHFVIKNNVFSVLNMKKIKL